MSEKKSFHQKKTLIIQFPYLEASIDEDKKNCQVVLKMLPIFFVFFNRKTSFTFKQTFPKIFYAKSKFLCA